MWLVILGVVTGVTVITIHYELTKERAKQWDSSLSLRRNKKR